MSFLCDTKKIFSFLVHHKSFIFNFYVAHWQYVDLLLSGPRNKETFNPSITQLPSFTQLFSKEGVLTI